jgi:glycerol uptake facilitator protein
MKDARSFLPAWAVGEFVGTFFLVFFGCGSVASAVLTGASPGLFQVAIVWGLGIGLAIYTTGGLSGAHLNPAVTLSLAAWNDFSWKRAPGYILMQMAGAFAASAVLYVIFAGPLTTYESAHNIVRGTPGSEASAMVFGEYFPNPGDKSLHPGTETVVSMPAAFLAEAAGTAVLVFVIFALGDERNRARPVLLAPMLIGLTITVLISILAPLTMAGFNPARDFAPRVFSALAGWGRVPFSANGMGWLFVYILGPIAGGLFGGGFYRLFFRPHYLSEKIQEPERA